MLTIGKKIVKFLLQFHLLLRVLILTTRELALIWISFQYRVVECLEIPTKESPEWNMVPNLVFRMESRPH